MSEIGRKACRKFYRLQENNYVEVSEIKINSTYEGHEIELFIPEKLLNGISAAVLRKILTWYLNQYEIKKQRLYVFGKGIKKTREIISCTKIA